MKSFVFRDISLVDGRFELRDHMDLVVEGGRIVAIAPTGGAVAASAAGLGLALDGDSEVYDGRGKVAMPGFFNAHCHVPMTLIRGYGEGLSLHDWLFTRMFPFENLLTDEDCYWGALLGIAEMFAGGTVSFTDMYMHEPGIVRAVAESGIKANLAHGYSARKPDGKFSGSNAWEGTKFLMEAAKADKSGRLVADASIHAEYTFGGESAGATGREIAEFCAANGLRLQIHLSETRNEHEEAKARRGMTPTAYFDSLGLFAAAPTTAAHCVWVDEADMDILAARGATVAHCPSSNLKLGSGIAPIKRMQEKGIRVAIGTDGAASNNNLDALEEANLAALVQKGSTGDPLYLGPKALAELACRNGALSQGRGDCGALAIGNKADVVVYDLRKPHLQPVHDALSNLMFAARSSDVALTMVDGRVLYRDGHCLTIDVGRVMSECARIVEEKLARLARRT